MADGLARAVSNDGGVAVRAVVATDVVREAARRHETGPTAASALGRTLVGAVLLGAGHAEDETVQVQFRGDGPLGNVTAIADGAGRVRGFLSHPQAEPPLRDGRLDVRAGIGRGVLAVVRFRPSWREPYNGLVPIQTGEIASDLAHYLSESEQTPSTLAIGVYLEPDVGVGRAGGFLVQALPAADAATVATVDRTVAALPRVTELLREDIEPAELALFALAGVGGRVLDQTVPRFHCACSHERVVRALALLGRDELRGLMARGEPVESHCRFCNERYVITMDELGALAPDA